MRPDGREGQIPDCPHCGKPGEFWNGETLTQWTVVCSVFNGGCGASGGYTKTQAEALALWSKRSGDIR